MLKTNKILKFILGAGNEDFEEIEKLSYVYACAGFNMIDTSAKIESVNAVKKGIIKAKKVGQISICTSFGLQEDIHLSKAFINQQQCINCEQCIKICDRNAIIKKQQ